MNLDNVTIVCYDGEDANTALKALVYSCRDIKFKCAKLLCPNEPTNFDEYKDLKCYDNFKHIDYVNVPKVDWVGYNNFILFDLIDHVDTDYCLTIQTDGFVLNPEKWSDSFLDYDYLGAKWDLDHLRQSVHVKPEIREKEWLSRVGNGGFSIRSKKLLTETANAPFICDGPEDAYICSNYYDYFIERGIKFGSEEVADKFSREQNKELSFDDVFGFHGYRDIIERV